ncbi:hypothetical protein ABZ590_03725 [Streptomyces hirsutus]
MPHVQVQVRMRSGIFSALRRVRCACRRAEAPAGVSLRKEP